MRAFSPRDTVITVKCFQKYLDYQFKVLLAHTVCFNIFAIFSVSFFIVIMTKKEK